MAEAALATNRTKGRPQSLTERFAAVNRDRLARVRDSLGPRQDHFLDVVPLLFHINHPMLPGYVSQDAPTGIANYSPSNRALIGARALSKAFQYERRVQRSYDIKALYAMGSPGTIGYSKRSDLDFWLCYDSGLSAQRLERLARKAQSVEAYAASIGLEAHFFLVDPERYRRGETLTLSDESSGTSQFYLLLDEFYRSGLLLAGLPPLWTAVPPEHDHRYRDYLAEMPPRQRHNLERDYIDFGGLEDVPAAEFFGAALWQLYKSIGAPYKSVLKLLLMETYAAEFPRINLLSHRFKQVLANGEFKLTQLDPYIMMYTTVEEYLMAHNDSARLELLRRCFYLKADIKLSRNRPPGEPEWRREGMQDLRLAWNWSDDDLRFLDDREHWTIETAFEERKKLVQTLRQSYSVLSEFARRYPGDATISQSDLNALGRQLYAAFDRKPGKLDVVTRGICPNPVAPALSVHSATEGHRWSLFSGTVTAAESAGQTPLRGFQSVVELVAWCHFNRLGQSTTSWHGYAAERGVTGTTLARILQVLHEFCPNGQIEPSASGELNEPARIKKALIFVNVASESPDAELAPGAVLTSNHTDPFQFGGRRTNLIKSIDLVYMTTWQEVFAFRYNGFEGLAEALVEATNARGVPQPEVTVYCFHAAYGRTIVNRIDDLINHAQRLLQPIRARTSNEYVAEAGDQLLHLAVGDDESLQYTLHAGRGALMNALAHSANGLRRLDFDPRCQSMAVLRAVYRANRRQSIQVFAGRGRMGTDLYVLDATGALFVQRQRNDAVREVLDHFHRFLNAIVLHSADDTIQPGFEPIAGIELYRLDLGTDGQVDARPMTVPSDGRMDYLQVRVHVDMDDEDRIQFTFFLLDHEFSSRELGSKLFRRVAGFVLSRRDPDSDYPIYITDLEFSPRFRRCKRLSAHALIDLLNYKRRIEYHLTKAMEDPLAPPEAP